MLALLPELIIKNMFCFWCCMMESHVVSLSPFKILPPSYLEFLIRILVIVWGVSYLVEVWVLIFKLVCPPLEVGYGETKM